MRERDILALIGTWQQEKAVRADLADGMFTDGNKGYQQGYADALDSCIHALDKLLQDQEAGRAGA